jgi:hypothetical protein
MMEMYWAGVKRELPYILLTLRKWQTREKYSGTILPDEENHLIHGFDTFVDQVTHSSRHHSRRYAPPPEVVPPSDKPPTYTEALENRAWDMYAELNSTRIKQAIRETLDVPNESSVLQRRAKMLLQSAQFLDIDKIIEYRDPERLLSFWKRPAPPQLVASSFDEASMPQLAPQTCSLCYKAISSSLFKSVKDDSIICEKCYRDKHYGQSGFTKHYKICCLAAAITPEISRKICHCNNIRRRDKNGKLRPLWPVDSVADGGSHTKGGPGKITCGLEQLTDLVAEAKYAATRMKTEGDTTLADQRRESFAEMRKIQDLEDKKRKTAKDHQQRLDRIKNGIPVISEFGTSQGLTTSDPENIPSYLQSITDNYPYGNVHMALRIGPLIIENGVAKLVPPSPNKPFVVLD